MGKRIVKYDVKLVKESSLVYELETDEVSSSTMAGKIIGEVSHLHDATVEKFGILCLNAQNKVVGVHIVATGSLDECVANPRDVFQRALLNNAHKIILFHNHPGGGAIPSMHDREITNRMVECGKLMTIKVVDHIIIYGENKYTSFMECGYMGQME